MEGPLSRAIAWLCPHGSARSSLSDGTARALMQLLQARGSWCEKVEGMEDLGTDLRENPEARGCFHCAASVFDLI